MVLVDQNTKEIADKILDMTKTGLIEVYSKVQQAAPDLWKLVIKQTMINGIEYFIAAALTLPLLVFGPWSIKKAFGDAVDGEAYFVGGAIATIIGLILFPLFLVNGLDLALNPSYWALKDILEMVRGH